MQVPIVDACSISSRFGPTARHHPLRLIKSSIGVQGRLHGVSKLSPEARDGSRRSNHVSGIRPGPKVNFTARLYREFTASHIEISPLGQKRIYSGIWRHYCPATRCQLPITISTLATPSHALYGSCTTTIEAAFRPTSRDRLPRGVLLYGPFGICWKEL